MRPKARVLKVGIRVVWLVNEKPHRGEVVEVGGCTWKECRCGASSCIAIEVDEKFGMGKQPVRVPLWELWSEETWTERIRQLREVS